jgi:hypothetical protein
LLSSGLMFVFMNIQFVLAMIINIKWHRSANNCRKRGPTHSICSHNYIYINHVIIMYNSKVPNWYVNITLFFQILWEQLHNKIFWGRDSSVGVATGYALNGPGIKSRCGRDLQNPSRPPPEPTRPPIKCTFLIVSRSILLRTRNFSDRFVENVKSHMLCSATFYVPFVR